MRREDGPAPAPAADDQPQEAKRSPKAGCRWFTGHRADEALRKTVQSE